MHDNYILSIDLDGTLLTDEKKISNYSLAVLKKCQKHGCKILINTSRSYIRTLEISEILNADYTSCFDGNYIFSKGGVLYKECLEKSICEEIINIALYKNIKIIVDKIDGAYRNQIKEYKYMCTNYFNLSYVNVSDCYKIIITNENDIKFFKEVIDSNNLICEYDSINKIYRILPPFSNKYKAIKYINKLLNNDYKTISFGDDISDYTSLIKSDIGIKVKNSSNVLSNIIFQTTTNNNDGVAKFLSNFFNFDMSTNYKNVKLLDCTLRDGGHLNQSRFGYNNIIKIIKNLVKSKIDFIEIGFLEDCIYNKDVARFNKVSEAERLLQNIDNSKSSFVLLTQVDKFDIKKLKKRNGKIDMIRVSFHKHLLDQAIVYCKIVKEKGYKCAMNPINFSGYNNLEIVKLLKIVNKCNIDYFTIVDTFGILTNNSFNNKLNLINDLLRTDINLGLHLHDNLSSSFSTAQILMKENSRYREIIIDSSLSGMGRSPGNLKTELIMYYLNKFNKNYRIYYVYDLIQSIILDMHSKYDWNIDFSYSISAFEQAHRTYAEYLKNKNVSYDIIEKIIKSIPLDNKDIYDKKVIEKLYMDKEG